MRLRNVKGSRENIAKNEFVVQDPLALKGSWAEYFGNNNPIHIEIGMGKGRFIMDLAKENEEINYIGIEKYSSVLIRALEKRREVELNNICFLRFDADNITDIFEKDEIDRIYLNFSDPWPKERHAKRRLTSKEFLSKYNTFLKPEGEVIFKTDNRPLFDFSLEEVIIAGWKIKNATFDLHQSEYKEGNIMTEYEERFVGMGHPIHRLVAFREL